MEPNTSKMDKVIDSTEKKIDSDQGNGAEKPAGETKIGEKGDVSETGLVEDKIYYPSEKILERANIKEYDKMYKYSITHLEEFWDEQANHLSWYKKWDKVLDSSEPPFYKWFTGAKTNIILNAIDRHQTNANRN